MENSINRQSNFELLRIIAIVLIVLSHYAQHGMSIIAGTASNVYKFLSMYFYTFGQIGVTIFILITGYFLVDKEFKISRILRVGIKTIFYSYLIFIAFLIFNPNILNFKNIMQSVLPISTNQYWFVTSFIMLGILTPVLNIVFKQLKKYQIELYLVLFMVLWFVLTCTYKISYCGSSLFYFIYIYFVGAYIKTYNIQVFEKKFVNIICLLFAQIIVCCWILFCIHISKYTPGWYSHLSHLNSIFTLVTGISIFYYLKNTSVKYNKIINKISSCVFAIYIITENCLIRYYIWTDWFNSTNSSSIDHLILNIFVSLSVSFVVCILLDILISPLINAISSKVEKYINRYYQGVLEYK